MLKNKFLIGLIVLFASVSGISAQTETKIFNGYLSALPIQMTLTKNNGKLTGSYFYKRVGKELKLDGTINADGIFTLKELDPNGKTTGEFSGKWADEASANGIALEGDWHKPNSANKEFFNAAEQMIFWTNGAKLSDVKFAEKNKAKRYEIDVNYPQISGIDAVKAATFNRLIKSEAMKSVAEFRKEMLAQTREDVKNLFGENSLGFSYSVEWATNDIISLELINSEFTGGAHGNYYSSSLTFDLRTGKQVKLAELFEPRTDFIKRISDYSINDLTTHGGEYADAEWIKTGAGADAENFVSWNLTAKGLMINFSPYQVASYAEGEKNIIVPYDKLKEIMRPEYAF